MANGQRVAIYLRQSLDAAGDELGISRQRSECERLCSTRGYEVVETIADNSVSASKHGRKGYAHLLELITARSVDAVVILRVDRLLRLNDELEQLIALSERTGVNIITVEGDIDLATPSGRLVARVLVSVARAEMETKSARHKLANAQKAAAGKPHGSPRPFGYQHDLVTIHEPEAALVREMARRVLVGESYKSVAYWLNAEGHTTAGGKLWYSINLRSLLKNPRYAGIRRYQGHDYPAVWQPILDMPTWQRLQLSMRLRTETAHPTTFNNRKYLLTGLAFCGICGLGLTGARVSDHHGVPTRRTYRCRGQRDTGLVRGCGGVRRNADALDHFIAEAVFYRLDTPELSELLASNSRDTELPVLLANRQAQQQRLDGLTDDYATGLLDRDGFARASATARTELSRLDGLIDSYKRQLHGIDVPAGQSVRDAWTRQDTDWRRALLELLIKRIVVRPGSSKPYYFVDGKRFRFAPELIDILWLV